MQMLWLLKMPDMQMLYKYCEEMRKKRDDLSTFDTDTNDDEDRGDVDDVDDDVGDDVDDV